jgi:hypothetical protein
MKARVTIEYDLDPAGQSLAALREREEQRWMTCETVLGVRSGTVKVELIEEPGFQWGGGP